MSTKQKTRKIDEDAQVGIGTMIVFIATVLVSAVAAGVLLDMSGKLQQKSSKTGSDATEEISSNIFIESIVGNRDDTADTGLEELDIYISLAPGASDIDLSELRIMMANDTLLKTFSYTENNPGTDTFNASEIRDADDSFSAATPAMTAGDLVKMKLNLTAASMEFPARESVDLTLIPEAGTKVATGFTTPASYGTKLVVTLY